MNEFKSFDDFRHEQHRSPEEGNQRVNADSGISPDSYESAEQLQGDPPQKEPVRHLHPSGRTDHFRRILYIFAVGFLILLIGLFMLPIPLGTIILSGTDKVTMEDVLFEGKIQTPVNVLKVNTSDLQSTLHDDLRVSEVNVYRSFPLTIHVDITDRVPVAILQSEFSYVYVDKEGIVIETTQALHDVKVPLITGTKMGNLLLGDQIEGQDIDLALQFLNNLTPSGLDVFSEINIGNDKNIRAYTRDGITVHLGNGENMDKQAQLAENMVGDVHARGLSVEYIDANFSAPFIKLKK